MVITLPKSRAQAKEERMQSNQSRPKQESKTWSTASALMYLGMEIIGGNYLASIRDPCPKAMKLGFNKFSLLYRNGLRLSKSNTWPPADSRII